MIGQAQYPAQVTLDAGGNGRLRIQQQNVSVQWKVSQVSITCAPTKAGTIAYLRQNAHLVDTSYFAGTGDTAGGEPALWLDAGEYIEVEFVGGPANGQGQVVAYYEELHR